MRGSDIQRESQRDTIAYMWRERERVRDTIAYMWKEREREVVELRHETQLL